MIKAALIVLGLLVPACGQAADPAAPEKQDADLSRDMISGLDDLIGRAAAKLDSDKPLTADDMDSVFDESFFAGSDDPVRDMDAVEAKVSGRPGDTGRFSESYNKWVTKKMFPAELKPGTSADARRITVRFTAPAAGVQLRVRVDRSRIKVDYDLQAAGKTARQHRMMPVPAGADPARHRVRRSGASVSVIFDRVKKNAKTEASK